jgi:putative cardiolipin synthase
MDRTLLILRRAFERWAILAAAGLVVLMQGCASLPPPPTDLEVTAAIPASTETALGRHAARAVAGATGSGSSGFRPLPVSTYSMDARLTLARNAQQSLDLQYYLLQNDVTGHKLLRAARDAAQRGVRVRLLVDDLYTDQSDRMLLAFAAYPNVQVKLFNPFPAGREFSATRWAFSLMDFARVNHRMHNKMFIADGAFAVAGGRNIANEYFFHDQSANFIDFDLLVVGDAVPRMQAIFDTYWNSPRVYPLHAIEVSREAPQVLQEAFEKMTADAESAYPTPPANEHDVLGYLPLSGDLERHAPLELLYGRADVFADSPEKVTGRSESGADSTTVTSQVLKAMGEARSEVVLCSPYFVPGKAGMAKLRDMRSADVRVSLLTNSLAANDEPFASAAYAHYRAPMLKLGIGIDEVSSQELSRNGRAAMALRGSIGRSHAKLLVLDRRISFVGSMNMDLRSSRENTELGMLIDSPALAKSILALIDEVRSGGTYHLRLADPGDELQWVTTEHGIEEVHDSEPEVETGTRVKTLLLSPLVSEGLL